MNKKKLLITDNEYLFTNFLDILKSQQISITDFDFRYSYHNKQFLEKFKDSSHFQPINIKNELNNILESYDLVISLHCKQLFPTHLVNTIRCINVHPGLNPYNRGWFPPLFSLINGLPAGVTIHEIDEKLDHGNIIDQIKVEVQSTDTSYTLYQRVLEAELELLKSNINKIVKGKYNVSTPSEGNLNLKKDFTKLCKLDLNNSDTLLNHLNLLRALTHEPYKNAYFLDKDGNKVYVSIQLTIDE